MPSSVRQARSGSRTDEAARAKRSHRRRNCAPLDRIRDRESISNICRHGGPSPTQAAPEPGQSRGNGRVSGTDADLRAVPSCSRWVCAGITRSRCWGRDRRASLRWPWKQISPSKVVRVKGRPCRTLVLLRSLFPPFEYLYPSVDSFLGCYCSY